MSDNANLAERVAALEKLGARQTGVGVKLLWLFGASSLVALLLGNLWLIQRELMTRQQSTTEHHFWVVCQEMYPAPIRTEAFLHLVAAGNQEWRSAHLDGLDLKGVSLSNVDLQRADFRGSTLAKACCVGTKFSHGKLTNTDFTEADLSQADLAGADLFKALLRHTLLRRANLRGAVMQQIEAQNASFIAANLSDAYLLMANLTGARLDAADLTGANLEAATLKGANLSLARLTGVNLKDTDFTDCNWWRARGLTSDQQARLIKTFPPSDKADASLREDYQAWLKKLQPAQ